MEYKSTYNEIYTEDFSGRHIGYIKFENIGSNTYCITETHVDFALEGQNVDGKLVELAVKEIRDRGGKITATDPFAKGWLVRNRIIQ